ncbi:MAG: hypothetical protein IPK20_04985 [Betaproteobacteria bacterium]|nr:hypothetical protein [Betaproteobacteria bacterium]
MSNEAIAKRLLEVAEGVLRGTQPSSAFADAVDVHGSAFEGLPRAWLDRLNRLSVQVIEEDVSPLEEQLLGLRNSRASLQEAASMLRALQGSAQQSVQPDRREDAASG